MSVIDHKEIKVNILYGADNLHTKLGLINVYLVLLISNIFFILKP